MTQTAYRSFSHERSVVVLCPRYDGQRRLV
jgi:hypothetical protein